MCVLLALVKVHGVGSEYVVILLPDATYMAVPSDLSSKLRTLLAANIDAGVENVLNFQLIS